ncbi:MAG: serine hydrolase domain-containing protein, partial [Pseudomonadales bacterium]|nr:serine hydrolase domain-containing protein [Pseudomonadales bacterium]
MQLVDEGVVSLDDPISKHLPELVIGDRGALERVTVQMLVNHSSGIDGEIVPEHGHDLETIAHAIPRFADMEQIHEPGEDCSYCNTATVIAGYMCQQLTETSWYDLVKERIFAPLGMEHAVALPEDALLHRASVGHFLNPETKECVRTTFAFLPLSFAPAGATLMMSAKALVAFARAHMNDGVGDNGERMLSAESARAMRTKTIDYQGVGFAGGFGLGWMLNDDGSCGHGGGGPGILSWLTIAPEKDFAIAVLTNVEHGGLIIEELMRPHLEEQGLSYFADALKEADEKPDVDAPAGETFVGSYGNCSMTTEILAQDDGYAIRIKPKFKFYDSMSLDWSPSMPIRFVADDVFVSALAMGPSGSVYRLVNFDNGKAGHLATGGRLYKRED